MVRYANFDPGGQTIEPASTDEFGVLVQFRPRWSIYLESEADGEFVVLAELSKWQDHGKPFPGLGTSEDAPRLYFNINLSSNNDILVENYVVPGERSKAWVFGFDLSALKPRLEPYEVTFFAATELGEWNFTATSELWYLPEKKGGSVSRIDNWKGGIHFRNSKTDNRFEPFLPYGFYGSHDRFLGEANSLEAIQAYSDLGLNAMVPLTPIGSSREEFEYMDKIDLKFMYDLRSIYKNLAEVRDQVTAIKDFESLYAYWGSDEPDGWQDPFDATVLSRNLIRTIDPYHPVSVTLNCQNYYFKEYTAGADFVMEDVYPIGINSTFSKWGTECNVTHGDCGCDNCQGNVQDVSSRLDDLARYEEWLGLWPKTKFHNPQSFHGENYWMRSPTPEEEVAMNALGFNHHAKGIVSWVWPVESADKGLVEIHGELAKVVTANPVRDFLVLGDVQKGDASLEIVDVGYWVLGGKMMVIVVNGGYDDLDERIAISLGNANPANLDESLWGKTAWSVLGGKLVADGMKGMATSIVVLDL